MKRLLTWVQTWLKTPHRDFYDPREKHEFELNQEMVKSGTVWRRVS